MADPARLRPARALLRAALGNARLEIIAGAGHVFHAEAPRRFHALLTELAGPAFGQLAPA